MINRIEHFFKNCTSTPTRYIKHLGGYHGRVYTEKNGDLNHPTWNSAELGPGLYVATDRNAALLYGVAAAQQNEIRGNKSMVELLEVYYDPILCRKYFQREKPYIVPLNNQYESFKASKSEIINAEIKVSAQEINYNNDNFEYPSQYCIRSDLVGNNENYPIQLHNSKIYSIDEAFDEADSKSNFDQNQKSFKIIHVPLDGHCFFNSIAFHVKMTSQERISLLNNNFQIWNQPKIRNYSWEIRKEIANWISFHGYSVQNPQELLVNQSPTSSIGHDFEQCFNFATDFGCDTQFLRSTLPETLKYLAQDPNIWGDINIFWKAIIFLYGKHLIVHHGGTKPLIFGTNELKNQTSSWPIEIYHQNLHFNPCIYSGPFCLF